MTHECRKDVNGDIRIDNIQKKEVLCFFLPLVWTFQMAILDFEVKVDVQNGALGLEKYILNRC